MTWNLCARDKCANMADGRSGDYCSIRCEEDLEGTHMTAFEIPIYPEEYPPIDIPVQYHPRLAANSLYGKRDQVIECTCEPDSDGTLTCKGLHTEVTICTGTETCKDPSHE